MGLFDKTEYAFAVYIFFFLAANIAGTSFFSDVGWAPYIESTSNSNAPSGATWVENKGLHWADGNNEYYMDYRLLRGEYHFDSGSGSTLVDLSGNNNDGTINGATWTSGRYGQALSFDGTDDYVDIGSTGITDNPRTITAWVKTSNTGQTGWTTVFGFAGGSSSNEFFDVQVEGDASDYVLHVYGNDWHIHNIETGWHHIAATYDGSTIRMYYDGQQVNSASYTALNAVDNVQIAKRNDMSNYFEGKVDEMKIYGRPLSSQEIQQLYNGMGSRTGGTPGNAWVEGNSLHWIDQDSVERAYTGTDTGNNPGSSGNIWIESGYIHYIDQNGNERSITP